MIIMKKSLRLSASVIAVLASIFIPASVFSADIAAFSAKNAYYHYKSGTVVYAEQKANNVELRAISRNGKKTLLSTFSTNIDSEDCAKLGDIGVSPNGTLVFVEMQGCMEGGWTEIYNLRTGKKLQTGDDVMLFDPNKDVFFSKDASRIAIRTEGNELMGVNASIYIQNPKTLKLVNVYSIKLSEYLPVYEKYGDDARLTLENIRFNGTTSVSFAKVIKGGDGKVIKQSSTTVQFPR